jgi:hypothetical protein
MHERHRSTIERATALAAAALSALLVCGCADDAGSGTGGDAARTSDEPRRAGPTPPPDAHADDPRPSTPFLALPPERWPIGVARHRADFRAFGRLEAGLGFLGREESGRTVALTAKYFVTSAAGLAGDAEVPYLAQLVKSWELVGESSGTAPAASALVGAPARAGLDAAGCDVLVLAATLAGAAPCEPLTLSTRVPRLGEQLFVASGDDSVRWRPTSAMRYGDGAYVWFELPRATAIDDVRGAAVLDARGFAVAVVTRREEPTDAAAANALFGAQLLRPILRSPRPLEGTPVRFDAPGFECIELDPTGSLVFLGSPMLGGARVSTWPAGALLVGDALPKGQGSGAFTAAGLLVTAGRGGAFALLDPRSGATLASGRVPTSLVTRVLVVDERRAVLGTSLARGSHLVDVTTGAELEALDVWCGAAALSPNRTLAAFGGENGVLDVVRVDPNGTGSWIAEARAFAGHEGELTALAFSADGRRLASGDADGVFCVWDVVSATRLWTCADAIGDVNALVFAGDELVVATGSIEDVDEERVPVASFVRVFDAATGDELARSHEHDTPVLALLPESRVQGAERRLIGVTIGSDHFRWSLP